jgi:hypothetical protein
MYALETYDAIQPIGPIDFSCCVYNLSSVVTESLYDDEDDEE